MTYVIFGAQGMARAVQEALEGLNTNFKIAYFLVSRREGNAAEIAGRPVKLLQEAARELSGSAKQNTEVLIAAPPAVMPEIEELLERYGFSRYMRMTQERLAGLLRFYHTSLRLFPPLSLLPLGTEAPFLRVYMACSAHDLPLREDVRQPSYIEKIQVGAAQSDRRLAYLRDDQGENISEKNRNYCELTALYWIWKNRLLPVSSYTAEQNCYFGLSHYRRILLLSEDDLCRLSANNVDVVLPFPLPYEPDIEAHHRAYLSETDWQAVLQAVDEVCPEDRKALSETRSQRYLYNCNMIIARKSVLREYCEWLFPILFRVAAISSPPEENRADRYLGYLSETLETVYFMKQRTRLHIRHTPCYELF